jgi:pimeloyl-ACP methyl ester carboxylesterase
MPQARVNDITMYYEQTGSGEPLLLIPYLAADNACYAFQVPEYAERFTCISVDPRGAGQSDKPAGPYSTEQFADDMASFLQALGITRAHVMGLSLGASIGMWLAAKYPDKVQSLSLHSAWHKTDNFVTTIVEGWRFMAQAKNSVPEMVIQSILPWCLTPELYAARPEYVDSLAAFIRGRPVQPVDAFMSESAAVLAHDASTQLTEIAAPTLITFGRHDLVTSTRFAQPLQQGIAGSELLVFESSAHAPIYEETDAFNQQTLTWLQKHTMA